MATRVQQRSALRRRRANVAGAVAFFLLLSGGGVIGVAMASQSEPAQPTAPVVIADDEAPPSPLTSREGGDERRSSRVDPSGEPVPSATLPRSLPVVVDIPSIGVHSVIRHLGQTDTGALETPAVGPHYNKAAWYRHSPTPGSLGPAILLGHVDSAAEGPSVFFRLGELGAGDEITVGRADGSTAVFEVDTVSRYAKNDFPTALVYGNIDHAGLRILTCGGPFDEVSGHYLDNIVVFASLVPPEIPTSLPAPRGM